MSSFYQEQHETETNETRQEYISLASFVSDEDVDTVIEDTDKERIKIIYHKVLARMEKLSEEMLEFEVFEEL